MHTRSSCEVQSPLNIQIRPGFQQWSVLWQLLAIMVDGILLGLSFLGAVGLHAVAVRCFAAWVPPLQWSPVATFIYLLLGFGWLFLLLQEGVYRFELSSLDSTERVVKALSVGLLLFSVFTLTLHAVGWSSRVVVIGWYLFSLLLLTIPRPILHGIISRRGRRGNVAIIGDTNLAASVLPALAAQGLRVRHVTLSEAGQLDSVDRVLLVLRHLDDLSSDAIANLERRCRELVFLVSEAELNPLGAFPVVFGGVQLYTVQHPLDHWSNRVLKRAFDVLCTGLILFLTLPIAAVLFVLIEIDSPGPLLYKQTRIGRNGESFRMWKFRTMVPNADQELKAILEADHDLMLEYATTYKLKNDPRITRLGRVLRRSSIDELPQLWNVLRGEMSLVGPRPIVASEVNLYGPAFSIVNRVKPGMTGLWQVSGRSEVSYDSRRCFDTNYVRRWSFWLDISILIRTIQEIIFPKAY